jgi:hypothetical protein
LRRISQGGKMNRKRWVLLATAFLIACTAVPLYAGEYAHSLGLSFKVAYHDYKEINEPESFKSTEAGFLPGIQLSYTYLGVKNPFYGRRARPISTAPLKPGRLSKRRPTTGLILGRRI